MLANTEEGNLFLYQVEQISMEEVSEKKSELISAGYLHGKRCLSQAEVKVQHGASMMLIESLGDVYQKMGPALQEISVCDRLMHGTENALRDTMYRLADSEDMISSKRLKLLLNFRNSATIGGKWGILRQAIAQPEKDFMPTARSGRRLLEQIISIETMAPSPQSLLQEELNDEMLSQYEELDRIMLERDRGLGSQSMTKSGLFKHLNTYIFSVVEVEEALATLENLCMRFQGTPDYNVRSKVGSLEIGANTLRLVLEDLGLDHFHEKECCRMISQAKEKAQDTTATIRSLICQSHLFRSALQSMKTNAVDDHEIEFATIKLCPVMHSLPFCWLRDVAAMCETHSLNKGAMIGKIGCVPEILRILKSGALKATISQGNEKHERDDEINVQVVEGGALYPLEFFCGGKAGQAFVATEASEIIEIGKKPFEDLFQAHPLLLHRVAEVLIQGTIGSENIPESGGKTFRDELFNSNCEDSHPVLQKVADTFGVTVPEKDESQQMKQVLLQDLDRGLSVVQDSWDLLAQGSNIISGSYLDQMVKGQTENQNLDLMDSMGQNFLHIAIASIQSDQELHFGDWWSCWFSFLDSSEEVLLRIIQRGREGLAGGNEGSSTRRRRSSLESLSKSMETVRVKAHLMEHIRGARCEAAYNLTVGSTSQPLLREQFPRFLALLIPTFKYDDCLYLKEFVDMFVPKTQADHTTFVHIQMMVAKRSPSLSTVRPPFLLAGTMIFHPFSLLIQLWLAFARLIALYHFVAVPVRLTFSRMLSEPSSGILTADLVFDALLLLHVLIMFNTSYQNKKSKWVSDRVRIVKRRLYQAFFTAIIPAMPFDWFMIMLGTSVRSAEWMRITKLAYCHVLFHGFRESRWAPSGFLGTVWGAFSVLHLLACGWTSLGQYDQSWLSADQAQAFIARINSEISHWEFYCMTLNWAAAHTVSSVGSTTLFPRNYGEVSFAILCLTRWYQLNLTQQPVMEESNPPGWWISASVNTQCGHTKKFLASLKDFISVLSAAMPCICGLRFAFVNPL